MSNTDQGRAKMHIHNLPWAEIPFFLSLARAGSFSAAATTLGKDRTTVSRRLARIEVNLGCQLFDRTDLGLVLTANGRRVLEVAELAEQEMRALIGAGERDPVRENVRIAISEHLLSAIANDVTTFSRSNPEYLLDFVTGDAHADLDHFEADVAVRISRREIHGLHAIQAGRPTFSLYALHGTEPATANYIARPGENEPPIEVRTVFPDMGVCARANGIHATEHLVRAGLGCAILPDYIGKKDPTLMAIEIPGFLQTGQINVVCRFEQRRLHRIRTTTRFLSDALSSSLGINGS